MFTVNGIKISLSSNDSLEIIKIKVASALNTIPNFIQTSEVSQIQDGGSYTITPLFLYNMVNNTIQTKTINSTFFNLSQILQQVKECSDCDLNFIKKLYIISKIQLTIEEFGEERRDQAIQFALFELETEIDEVDTNVWELRNTVLKDFKEMIEQNQKNIKKQEKSLNFWDKITPTFNNTNFVLNKINHQTEIPNVLKLNEYMVFDSIKLNNIIIGCFYQDLIKYNPDYTYLIDDYLNQDKMLSKKLKASDIVRIMLNVKEITNITNLRTKYKMVNIFVGDKITFTIETFINEPNLFNNLKAVLTNILKDIGEAVGQKEGYENRTEKEFYYGSYSSSVNIPLIVLKDLITNDPNVYTISYINETALINTRKTNLNIFLKAGGRLQGGEDIGISLFEKPDTVGTFIRVKRIRGGNDFKTRVDENILITSKILQYTKEKMDDILKFYKKYIDLKVQLQPLNEINQDKQNMLKVKAPEIFLANYTRLCNKPPEIVEDNVKVENVPEGCNDEFLKFPNYGESDPLIFKCPYPDFKYPGLRENTKLANKNIYPFVPCCYQRPQKNSKNCKMYFNQEIYEQRLNSGEIGKTLKILAPRRIGTLPPKVDKLLNYTTEVKFYRFGIPQSKASILDLLNMVTDNQNSEKDIRMELAKRSELCKGEFSSITAREISRKIMDTRTYLSPRYFKGALEDYYQISYILFSKDEDDFSVYPNRFIRFICPPKKKVVLIIEHEAGEHTELIVDEETINYVNKQGKKPIFTFDKNDTQIKKIFSKYKERFNHVLYNIETKNFVNLLNQENDETDQQSDLFQTYPWEYSSPNGKILKYAEPLNQYIDSYGQTRLIEFLNDDEKEGEKFKFVGQFQPLPCLKLPSKPLEYFVPINGQLKSKQLEIVKQFSWCSIYQTKLDVRNDYNSPYFRFQNLKRLAEYIFWACCHAYSKFYRETGLSVHEWITNNTRIVENFTYAKVTIKPIFDLTELMVDNKIIFDSEELQNRVKYNLTLISTVNLRLYESNVYKTFFNDIENFNVVYPAQLAMTKREYFQRTREPYTLNILTTKNLQYLKYNTLYFIKEIFGYYSNILCLFLPSLDKVVDMAKKLLYTRTVSDDVVINVVVFDQKSIHQYSVGTTEPSIDTIVININKNWFYGLILPNLL
jgi:hypothetical protein